MPNLTAITDDLTALTNAELQEQLAAARALVTALSVEQTRRWRARQPIRICNCGHRAQDPYAHHCDEPTCDNFLPF